MDTDEAVDVSDSVDTGDIAGDGGEQNVAVAEPSPNDVAPQQAQQQEPSVWSNFKKLPEFQGQDDRAIATHLYQAMQRERAAQHKLAQYQQYIPYAQEWLANQNQWQEYQQWKSSQGQPPAPEQPKESAWWNPPELKEGYRRYLVKDESGRDVIAENAPLEARNQLEGWMEYRAEFARKFLENPEQTLGPMIEKMAHSQAEKIVQEKFERQANEDFVRRVEEENKDWLRDENGQNYTADALLVHNYVNKAVSLGITSPQDRWEYAVAMAERDKMAAMYDQGPGLQQPQYQYQPQYQAPQMPQYQPQYQPQPPQAPAAPVQEPVSKAPDLANQNMEYLRKEASRKPSRSAGNQLADPRAPKPRKSFEQLFREQASEDGLL